MSEYLVLLSDFSYELGLIGLPEYRERLAIADWLFGKVGRSDDPHTDHKSRDEESDSSNLSERPGLEGVFTPIESSEPDGLLRFLVLNRWIFTLGDKDCYPSVPHGHLHKKTNSWPKLNPYVGRVYSGMHQEDVRSRLKRHEMILLWTDQDFVRHCKEQVLWYSDFSPNYLFPYARRGRLRFPRWRK